MAKIVTFGELMLRLAPNGYYRFFQNDQMQATFGGGEANVSVSLANYGMESVFVTKFITFAFRFLCLLFISFPPYICLSYFLLLYPVFYCILSFY